MSEKSIKRLKKKLKKLEYIINNRRSESISRTRTRSPSWTPRRGRSPAEPRRHKRSESRERPPENETEETENNEENPLVDLTENQETEEDISEEVLALLGETPQGEKYGPNLNSHLLPRWLNIIDKGLDKDIKNKLLDKYPPPDNCKVINAPKLNPEAAAAAGENIVKRDKAIESKQKRVSSAISALGLALNELCKQSSANKDIITYVSDAARLLCDYHHCESSVRKHFILSTIESKAAREAIKETSTDQWLFGEDFSEKLKTAKAIEKSSKDLKGPNKPKKMLNNHLNYRGPVPNTSRMKIRPQRGGPQAHQRKQPYTVPGKQSNYQQKPRYRQMGNNNNNYRHQ